MEGDGARTYRLDPLDPSGVFLGLGLVQVAVLGFGIAAGVVAVTAGLPIVVAAAPVLLAAAVGLGRIAGHPVWEWGPLGWRFLWQVVRRQRFWIAPLPLLPDDGVSSPALPDCLAGLDVVEVPWRGSLGLGAIRDREQQTLTAVLPVSGMGFTLEAPADQDRKLAFWGDLLSQFAGGAVSHLSWTALGRPAGAIEGAKASDRHDDAAAAVAAVAMRHEVVVTVTVARYLLGRHRRGREADEHLAQSLTTALDALQRGLRSAELDPGDPLRALGIHRMLRTHLDPVTTVPSRSNGGRLRDRLTLVTPASSGPLALKASWSNVVVDGTWQRTWWVACWPRLAVPAAWMEPFMSAEAGTRSMTVVFMPISSARSRRTIQRDLVKLESDATSKEERGRRTDAAHHRTTEALLQREQELVAGHTEMAYVGLVRAVASSEDELEDQSEIVEQLAHEVGIELRLLDGRQDVAWAAALPLGLAPRTLVST